MANFNAGAIEGTLTLDRSPFNRELKEAQAAAKKFEQSKIKVPVELGAIADELRKLQGQVKSADDTIVIDTKIENEDVIRKFRNDLRTITDETVNIEVHADKNGDITKLRAKLKAIPDEEVNVDVDVDDKGSTAKILGGTRALNGMRFAIAIVSGLLPAFTALIAGAAAGLVALAGAAGILAIGIGAFALVAIPAMKRYKDAVKAAGDDTSKLPPEMLMLKNSIDGFNKSIDKLSEHTNIFAVMSVGLDILTSIMGQLQPVIKAVSDTFLSLLISINTWAQGPELKGVISFVADEFGPTFMLLADIFGNLIQTLGYMTGAFQPFTKDMLGGLKRITDGWVEWAKSLSTSDKFQAFMDFVRETGPKVLAVFGAVGAALINIGKSLAPLASTPVLNALMSFFGFIATMNTDILGALIVGIAAAIVLFQAWTAAVAIFNLVLAANPIALVIIAILALAAVFIYLFKTNKTFHDFVVKYLFPVFKFLGQLVYTTFRTIVLVVSGAITALVVVIRTWVVTWIALVRGGAATIQAIVRGGWAVIQAIFKTVTGTILAIVRTFNSVLGTVISTGINAAKTIVGTILAAIKALFSGNFKDIPTIVSNGFSAIKGIFSDALSSIRDTVSGGIDKVVGLFSNLGSTISGAVGNLGGVLVDAGRSIISGLISGVQSMIPSLSGVLGGITSKLPSWKGPADVDRSILKPSGQMILDGFMAGISDRIPDVKSLLGQITDGLPDQIGTQVRIGTSGSATTAGAGSGMTRDEFVAAIAELIRAIQDNTQPLIGEYNDASKDPREIAEEFWFISKGRGF